MFTIGLLLLFCGVVAGIVFAGKTALARRRGESVTWGRARNALVAAAAGFALATYGASQMPASAPTNKTTPAQQENAPTQNQATRSTESPKPPEPPKPQLELLDAKSESEDFARYVVGTIRNNSERSYGYIQVEINLYDDSGAQVGSTLDNANNLEPGGIWKFKALITDDRATKFKVADITGR